MRPTLPLLALSVLLALSGILAEPGAARASANDYNPWNLKYGLTEDERRAVADSIKEGEVVEAELRRKNRGAEADQLSKMLKTLKNSAYSRTNNPLGAYMGAYAFVYSGMGLRTFHLYQKFFDITKLINRINPNPEMARKAKLEQLSLLIHEYWHLQYKDAFDFGRPESEAYLLQHQWLSIFGVKEEGGSQLLFDVQSQLAKMEIPLPKIQAVEDTPEPDPAVEPGAAAGSSAEEAVCAGIAGALARDAAKKDDPQRRHRSETKGYTYDAQKKCCKGSHKLWQSYEGGPWVDVYTFYSPEYPACVSMDTARAWLK